MKNPILLISFLFLVSCNHKVGLKEIAGETQGTTYHIKYIDGQNRSFNTQVDSILELIDHTFSLWDTTSILCQFNKSEKGHLVNHPFKVVYNRSLRINKETKGAFDPSVAPILEVLGFLKDKRIDWDSIIIDSLRQYIGMDKSEVSDLFVTKEISQFKLDFNAIAQGYTVDLISEFLEGKGVENYMVEVGGELRTRGKNLQGNVWKIGIDRPEESSEGREFSAIVELENKALATSGNYRKFFEENGVKYAHTINPTIGYPVRSNLLSATVITDNCMDADAYATAFMVMGVDKTITFLKEKPNLEVFLIYTDSSNKYNYFLSPRLADLLSVQP